MALLGERLIAGECVLLKVPWRRGVGAGVTDAEMNTLAVSLHVASSSKALATVQALVRA